jgi:hypothetical protein
MRKFVVAPVNQIDNFGDRSLTLPLGSTSGTVSGLVDADVCAPTKIDKVDSLRRASSVNLPLLLFRKRGKW